MTSRKDRARYVKTPLDTDGFWDISNFRDFEAWERYWKPLVTVYLKAEDRVNSKKSQRYDDLDTAHKLLQADKCGDCVKVLERDNVIAELKAELKELESINSKLSTRKKSVKKD